MRTRPDTRAINARLAERAAELALTLAGKPSARNRRELRFRGKGALAVVIAGPKCGSWIDREAGCGGGPLGLIAHLRQIPMRDAYAWALRWLGEASRHRQASAAPLPLARSATPRGTCGGEHDRARWSADMARRIWAEAVEPAGTLVEAYLPPVASRCPRMLRSGSTPARGETPTAGRTARRWWRSCPHLRPASLAACT